MNRLRRNPAVSETVLDDETFLVLPELGQVYYLDPITSGLWRLLEEPQTLEDCQAVFRDAFPDQPASRIDGDIAAALDALEARRLVVRGD